MRRRGSGQPGAPGRAAAVAVSLTPRNNALGNRTEKRWGRPSWAGPILYAAENEPGAGLGAFPSSVTLCVPPSPGGRLCGRGTPQGGFSCPCGAIHLQPLSYETSETTAESGRGGPWASRRIPAGKCGRPQGPPLRRKCGKLRFPRRGRSHWFGKARRTNGTAPAPIFHTARAPVGPEEIAECHSDFARRKGFAPDRESAPVTGVRGKAAIGERSSPLRRPPAAFW